MRCRSRGLRRITVEVPGQGTGVKLHRSLRRSLGRTACGTGV